MAVYRSAITEITRRIDGLEAIRHALLEWLETAAGRAISPAYPAHGQPRMDSVMHDYTALPDGLPEPHDDGAADHLPDYACPHCGWRARTAAPSRWTRFPQAAPTSTFTR